MGSQQCAPVWMKQVLIAAAIYNVIWGGWVVLFPNACFLLIRMAAPKYPEIWQSVGMIVGVYGIGYFIASFNPYRHWPIVLVGFLGKLFGPIGFVKSALTGSLPWRFGWMNVTNDLIWLIPFAIILWKSYFVNKRSSCLEET